MSLDRYFFGLCGACILGGLVFGGLAVACATGLDTAPPPVWEARWSAITPPRSGLRCWHTYDVGHGASFCEPDPTSTHGASP